MIAAAGYVAGLVVAIAATVIAALGGASWNDAGALVSGEPEAFTGSAVSGLFLLVGMALFATLGVDLHGQGGFSVFFPPLSITLVILLAVAATTVLLAHRALPRRPATAGPYGRHVLVESLLVGGFLGLGGAVVAALGRVTTQMDGGYSSIATSVGAHPLGVFLGGVVLGATGSFLGSLVAARHTGPGRTWARAVQGRTPALVRRSATALLVGAVPTTAVLVAVLLVAGLVELGLAATAAIVLTFLPNALVAALGLGALGGLQASVVGGGESVMETVTLFHPDVPTAAWFLLLAPVVGALATGLRLYLASPIDRRWAQAWVTPTLLAVGALLGLLLAGGRGTGVLAYGLSGSSSFSMAVQLAGWTLLVAAAWGMLAEVVARTVAPSFAALLPRRLVARLTPVPDGGSAPAPVPPPPPSGTSPATALAETTSVPPLSQGATPPDPGNASASPVSRRKALLVVGGVGLGVVLVVGGLVARGVINDTVYSPAKPVEAYLDALERGDAAAAFALADPDVANSARTLLTNEVYGDVAMRPSGSRVTEIVRDGDVATVTAIYDQDGAKSTVTFTVRRDGSELVVFDRWALVSPEVPTLTLPHMGGVGDPRGFSWSSTRDDALTIVVNGTEVALGAGNDTVRALPGRYEVTLPDAGELLTAPTVAFVVAPGRAGPEDEAHPPIVYSFTPAARTAAEEAAREHLEACLAQSTAHPEGCGFRSWAYSARDTVDVSWSLVGEPVFEVTDEGDRLQVQVSDAAARMTGTLPAQPDVAWGRKEDRPVENEVNLRYSEHFTVQDGELVPVDAF